MRSDRSARTTSSTTPGRTSPGVGDVTTLMLDVVGSRSLSDCRRALTARGTYVLVGVLDVGRWFGLARQFKVLALSPFVRQTMRVFIVRHNNRFPCKPAACSRSRATSPSPAAPRLRVLRGA
jgi:hypothetical protein